MFLKYSSDRPSSKGINRVSVECEPVNQPHWARSIGNDADAQGITGRHVPLPDVD